MLVGDWMGMRRYEVTVSKNVSGPGLLGLSSAFRSVLALEVEKIVVPIGFLMASLRLCA